MREEINEVEARLRNCDRQSPLLLKSVSSLSASHFVLS